MNNVVSAHRYKVFAPDDPLLRLIVNGMVKAEDRATIGTLRTMECGLSGSKCVTNIPVDISMRDFKGCRTAMFGKTRLGKSNIVKLLAQAMMDATANDHSVVMLMVPLVGFLPARDERVRGTVAAAERELLRDGFVQRYTQPPDGGADGLPPGEGAFLACSFWLADNYALAGRSEEARELFEALLALRNDVGLLAEEYDPRAGRLVGNFPQAFSHVPLIDTARNLSRATRGPSQDRQREGLRRPHADNAAS